MTDRYAVMDHPVAHSKSPFIHGRFARLTGQDLRYDAIRVEPGDFATAVNAFFASGGLGLNVTLPFKQEAWALATEHTGRAAAAEAVNTLWTGEGRLFGDNTDGVGLVRDLVVNQRWQLAERRVLLLGAGGAARGVLLPLLGEAPAELVVANRTPARAEALCARFADAGRVRAAAFEALAGESFDLVINATAASLEGEVPPLPPGVLREAAACYDMMYAAAPTAFLRWASAAGAARLADGVGMLVEQAAESFLCWRGVRPETAGVIRELRALLAAA